MSAQRILIVDDESGIRSSLSQVLGDEGFEVEAVSTGEKGLERLRESNFHLVLLDVWLPRRDGLEILQEIKTVHPDVAVVMISGHASVETAVKATKLGAFDFVEKPLSLEKISLVVRNALKHRRLEARDRALRESLRRRPALIGESDVMLKLAEQIQSAAPTNGRVLILGENGTGKEVVAKTIHALSDRADEPFVEVNCAAIPEELIESELFGHVKGAFTGAGENKKGKFELADGGTLFLDEIGDMSLKTQAKVLRVLQEQTFEPVGGVTAIKVDVRVIAATNKDLPELIRKGGFREDLYFRLNVLPLRVPALRERPTDIPLLARHFLAEFARHYGRDVPVVDPEVVEAIKAHPWPGNVRELRNIVERMTIMGPRGRITVADLPPELGGSHAAPPAEDGPDLLAPGLLRDAREKFERWYIGRRLRENGGNVTRTAESLGVERSHLHRKMRAFGLGSDRQAAGRPLDAAPAAPGEEPAPDEGAGTR
ncbi:MAG TPA: sigma-54 dependent transcriptional regulator [Verrucomicrobiae bacterium]|nr:sigma-54 dependent transcriptional regulator [Verrucomicrobiae bacterium]